MIERITPGGEILEWPDGTPESVVNRVYNSVVLEEALESGNFDGQTGAPSSVRLLVGGVPGSGDEQNKAKLDTIRVFFPEAIPVKDDPGNFLFMNPETGQPTLYNPRGLDTGDIPSVTREIVQGVGAMAGASKGAVVGAPGGPVGSAGGALIGGGLGAAAGEEAFNLTAQQFGMQDSRSLGERFQESGELAGTTAAGDIVSRGAGRLFNIALKRALRGKSAEEVAKNVATFRSIGVEPTAGQAARSKFLLGFEGVISKIPGGAGPLSDHARRVQKKIGEQVKARARNLAAGRTEPEIVGRKIAGGVEGEGGFVSRFKRKGEDLFDTVPIEPDMPTNVSNTRGYLSEVTSTIPGAEETSQSALLRNPLLADLAERLEKDALSGNMEGMIPYEALKAIRSRVGDRLASFSLIDDVDRGTLKGLYAALTQDMKAAAEARGPEALKAFERANTFWKAGQKRIEDVLSRVIKKTDHDLIVRNLFSASKEGGTRIRAVMRSLKPDERDALTGSILERLGRARPGAQDELGEVFKTETFLTNWNTLSDEAKDALFSGTKLSGLRGDLDRVAKVAARLREAGEFFANPPETARGLAGTTLGQVGGGSAAVGLVSGNTEFLLLGTTLLAGSALANGGARLMTNPGFVNWLARGAAVKPSGVMTHLGRLAGIAANADPGVKQDIQEILSLIGTANQADPRLTSGEIGRRLATSPAANR